MPYISAKDDRRESLRNGEPALIAGELNYQLFYHAKHVNPNITFIEIRKEFKGFVDQFLGTKPNYQRYNDMTGALVRCAKEVKRRLGDWVIETILLDIMNSYDKQIDVYEDEKIISNGDVE
jgi:hypothetical protein